MALEYQLLEGIQRFRMRKTIKTQAELAKILEVDATSISLWEAGKGIPGSKTIKKLLEMGATVEELFKIDYNKMHGLGKIRFNSMEQAALLQIKEIRAKYSMLENERATMKPEELEGLEQAKNALEFAEKMVMDPTTDILNLGDAINRLENSINAFKIVGNPATAMEVAIKETEGMRFADLFQLQQKVQKLEAKVQKLEVDKKEPLVEALG